MRLRGGLFAIAAAGSMALVPAGGARADDIDDANRKLADLDSRVRTMSSGFRDNVKPDPQQADRRLVDAQRLFEFKSYSEAATLALDIIEKYPNSRAYDDAILLLGESLYQTKDYNSAHRYFEQAIKKNTGSRNEQRALQRLIEISLRTDNFDNIEDILGRLDKIPPENLDPSVPYVRGKYLFFRDKPDEALAVFDRVPASNTYYLQARYFIATIQVKKPDLAAASTSFDSVLRMQPRTDDDKEIQDLARMAIGRVYYERGQFDKAKDAYASVPRQSKYFPDAMYESAWNAIKAKDFKGAYRALDLMLLQAPDSPQAPELRLLMGNLNLRLANYFVANGNFSEMRDQFEPIHKSLLDLQKRAATDPKYFDSLIGKNLEKFDVAVIVPPAAARWIKPDAEMARMLGLFEEVGELQRGIRDSEQLAERIDRAVNGQGRVGVFPDLAAERTRSTEVLNQTLDIRRRFSARLRGLTAPQLAPDEKGQIEQIAGQRQRLEAQIHSLPLTGDAIKARDRGVRVQVSGLDAQASELNVLIRSLEAELVAIEQYFILSGADQKIRPEDLKQPVADLRAEITVAQTALDKIRNEIDIAGQEAGTAGAAGASERTVVLELGDLMKKERELFDRARGRLSGGAQGEFDAVSNVLRRADGIQTTLVEFDGRVEAVADKRLVEIREKLSTEKANLQQAAGKLQGLMSESQSVGGGLAQAMLSKVTDRFYDLVVQSDVGLIDVSWGLKDAKTGTLSKLINQQKLELKSVEDDFKSLLEEDKK